MFELTINDAVYQFRFGMGFLREINKRVSTPVDGLPDVKKNIGLRYLVSGLYDKDIEDLVEVLDIANKTENPRITRKLLDNYLEDENTDIEQLFEDVLDFLRKANVTKSVVTTLDEEAKKLREKQAQK
jgi:hypothetical protein